MEENPKKSAPYPIAPARYAVGHHMVTTTFELPGFRVVRMLGVVRGITVRSNAILGARYDATEIMSGVTEVLAYGTAVIVEPLEDSGYRNQIDKGAKR